jgi:hypothetical protein
MTYCKSIDAISTGGTSLTPDGLPSDNRSGELGRVPISMT